MMAWRRTGDKPLSEPMMTHFNDAYMRHSASYVASSIIGGNNNAHLGENRSIDTWRRHAPKTMILLVLYFIQSHDDVIKWKHFPRYWPLWGNSPVTGESPSQRPVTRSLDVIFDLRLNKRLSKQSCGWWFETSSHSIWRHCNGTQRM